MNFVSHAYVSLWLADDPAFTLGSMLPDLASMSRGRLGPIEHPELAAGVRHHHETDAVFHAHETFHRLMHAGVAELEAAGLRRGPARAAAHVAVELLLDGTVQAHAESQGEEHDSLRDAFLTALERAVPEALGGQIRWRQPEAAARFENVRTLLANRGLPSGYRDPAVVSERTARVLARRPRLTLQEEEQRALDRWTHQAQPAVAAATPSLLDEMREMLATP